MQLVIIRGIPGSGKSTHAKSLMATAKNPAHFEADMFFTDADGNYNWDPAHIKDAHKWCQDSVRDALNSGKHDLVIVSNTFVSIAHMLPYIEMASEANAGVSIIRMETYYGNIHDVPYETVERMRQNFEPYEGETIIR